MKYKITLIVMTLVAITIAITNEIRIIELKRSFQSQLNRLNSNVTQKINEIEKEVNTLQGYYDPNGIVEKFIVSKSFLEKNLNDLDKILTHLDEPSNAGYIQIYIIGHNEVWVSFKNPDGKFIFQGNLKPGLNPYKFYFFKSPSIETQYTYQVPYNSSFKSGVPDNTYFLIKEPGQYRLIKHPNKEISNIMKDLNLYIPTVTGQ
ncbi:MAG: hypothetical protein WBH84_05450 [Defluviitoga tunisiensis]|jgi:hypothetical protein|nr:hypothetical protein [Defluviitoga tunisiensis]MDY0378927.1 hypothetical protein [Defluviitoga tunisiensis]HHV01585.1 hypothetical protein [Defluviitoga tunisiensis]HOK17007.1 hypothetical protein [Defluviitoga tunisiensis]HOL87326.1 hypothetical protein [Defluviitoga tunisiensis]